MALLCAEKRTIFMDCPVSGGVGAATAGTLSFMVGGPSDEMEAAKSVLEFMGAKVFPCGDVGTGQGKIIFFHFKKIKMIVSPKLTFSCKDL